MKIPRNTKIGSKLPTLRAIMRTSFKVRSINAIRPINVVTDNAQYAGLRHYNFLKIVLLN